jgi:hypothetical protein
MKKEILKIFVIGYNIKKKKINYQYSKTQIILQISLNKKIFHT